MTARSEVYDVLIAGTGLTGEVLALALTQGSTGLRVGLIGPGRPDGVPAADPRAFAISAASKSVLGAVGIWPLIATTAQPVLGIDITDGKLESPVRPVFLHYDNVLAAGEPASFIVEASVLRRAVTSLMADTHTRVAGLKGPVQSIGRSPHGIVLRIGDGEVVARLAVAAEGRRSTLRELAGIKSLEWSYPQSALVTTVNHERPHEGKAVQHFLPAGPFAILPLAGGHRSSLVWSEERTEAARLLALDDTAFDAELGQRFGGLLGTVRADGPRLQWALEMHIARSFVGDRLALVGDAARTVHPIAGQGLNIGLRDVAALAEIVVDSHRLGLDIGAAEPLARYERWRRFDSVVSAMAMDGLNRLFSNDNSVLRSVRDLGLAVVDQSPLLKQFFVNEAAGLTGEVPRLMQGESL